MSVDRSFSSHPVAPPIYTSSVYALTDLDMLERISSGAEAGFIYARDNHPNAALLGQELAKLENGQWSVVAASGMAAIVATVLAVVKGGDRIIASDQLYGRTTQFLGQELARLGITTTWCDTSNLQTVEAALKDAAQIVIVETISNPMLRLADIEKLAELCHRSNSLLLVDNTFATPTLVRPLDLGAGVVIESLTKLIGGHSDITLGVAVGKHEDLGKNVATRATIWGMPASPFDCWLAHRSLPTLALRVRTACENAAQLSDWLSQQKNVTRVIYPGRSDHPDFELAQRLIAGPPGNMITFELPGGRAAVNQFMKRCPGIPFCPSLGDTATTCSYPSGTSHRYVDAETKQRLGITDGMIRLSVGIESLADIQKHLASGLG